MCKQNFTQVCRLSPMWMRFSQHAHKSSDHTSPLALAMQSSHVTNAQRANSCNVLTAAFSAMSITQLHKSQNWVLHFWNRCPGACPLCTLCLPPLVWLRLPVHFAEGVGLYHLTKEVRTIMAKLTKMDSDNYPETLYHTCIINAPSAFRAMWSVVKPMLNKRTQEKIEVSCRIQGRPRELLFWLLFFHFL